MVDVVSKKKRSQIMSSVRSKETKIEIVFRKALWKEGFRYRKNVAKCFGKPDLVLKKYGAVIFVDSCFWHGCKRHCRLPEANKSYWINKIARNRKRDKEVNKHYRKMGWNVIRVWEHDINKDLSNTIERTIRLLRR